MSRALTNYRVFIASPGGLINERNAFHDQLHEYNISEANHRGVHFSPEGWEITLSGAGRPQEKINTLIRECDYLVLLLHDRWGSSPYSEAVIDKKYTSATEEEFDVACECLEDENLPMREIVLFFKAVDAQRLSDPGEQLKRVLQFRDEREKKKDFLFSVVDTVDNFSIALSRHLADWVRSHEKNTKKSTRVESDDKYDMKLFLKESKDIGISKNNTEEGLLRKAEHLAEEGKHLEAELLFSKLVVSEQSPLAIARFGRFLRKSGQHSRARSVVERAIELAKINGDSRSQAYALRQLARIDEFSGDLGGALTSFHKALVIYEDCYDCEGQARTLRNIASVYRKQGHLEQAEKELDSARALYELLDNKDGVAAILGYKGLILKSRGKFEEALEAHQQALNIHEGRGEERALAVVRGNIGVAFRSLGRYVEALEMHELASQYYIKVGEAQGIARELSNLGITYRHLGELNKAMEYHERALSISESENDYHGMAIQYGNIGTILLKRGEYDAAEKYFLESQVMSEKINDKSGMAIQKEHLGMLYKAKQEYKQAEIYFQEAITGYKELDNRFGKANSLRELGEILFVEGRRNQGEKYLEDAIEIYHELRLHGQAELTLKMLDRCIGDLK